MLRRCLVVVGGLVLCLLMGSCTKLYRPAGPLVTHTIPQEYGSLIAVTQSPPNPGVGLWFQKSDGTVTAVFVNTQDGTIDQRSITILRK